MVTRDRQMDKSHFSPVSQPLKPCLVRGRTHGLHTTGLHRHLVPRRTLQSTSEAARNLRPGIHPPPQRRDHTTRSFTLSFSAAHARQTAVRLQTENRPPPQINPAHPAGITVSPRDQNEPREPAYCPPHHKAAGAGHAPPAQGSPGGAYSELLLLLWLRGSAGRHFGPGATGVCQKGPP